MSMSIPARPTPALLAARPRAALIAHGVDPAAYRPAAAPAPTPGGTTFVLRFTAAVISSDLHPYAKLIALALAGRAHPSTGWIRDEDQLGARSLASLVGIGDSAAKNSLDKLRRSGFIRRTPPKAEGCPARIELFIPDRP